MLQPVNRQNLADDIAQRITRLIVAGRYEPGARLPAISAMAKTFGVGAPTLREALKKLETVGILAIRHGSGVYVGRSPDSLLMANPVFGATPTKQLLLDLIEARILIETQTARLAARAATRQHIVEMEQLLADAADAMKDSSRLSDINMSFHRHIALASGNAVLHQILDVLCIIFRHEQRRILDIHGRRADDHAEHLGILAAIAARDEATAESRMRGHLTRVREVIALRFSVQGSAVAGSHP